MRQGPPAAHCRIRQQAQQHTRACVCVHTHTTHTNTHAPPPCSLRVVLQRHSLVDLSSDQQRQVGSVEVVEGVGHTGGTAQEARAGRLPRAPMQRHQAARARTAHKHITQHHSPAQHGPQPHPTPPHDDPTPQEKLERLAAAVEAERTAECTFQPTINRRSASLGRLRRSSGVGVGVGASMGSASGLSASLELQHAAAKLRSSILVVGGWGGVGGWRPVHLQGR